MIELSLNKIQKYYGANLVLEDISFDVQTSEKVGIVGSNGCGKSTLLKIIIGEEECDNGILSIKKDASIGYLEQMPIYPNEFKVKDVLNKAFEKIDKLNKDMALIEKQLERATELNMNKLLIKLSSLQYIYETLGGYDREEKLSKVCIGLNISEEFKEKLFSELSGGEKTTVILGKILLQNPDILLLDEPSNHLDLDSMEWLETYLKEYKGIVVIVSHDRYFLDNVVTKIIEIEDKKSKIYEGNYTEYQLERERQLNLQMDTFLDQQKKIKAMEKSITQLRDWAIRADNNKFFRRAASMQKRLDKVERIDKPILEKESIKINSKSSERSGNDVVIIKDLFKNYGERVLLNKANLLIKNGESVALIGENGSGKSTLIKILLGMEEANGIATLGSSIKLGYLPQNIIFNDENKTVLDCFREEIVISDGKAREYLAKYMFFGEMVFKKVKTLSGGERSRLKLAELMFNEVNFLILDEPTNHLDIDSREQLEIFLKEFEGTLMFVSHDRYFINNIASRIVELYNGLLVSYGGNYEYYREKSKGIKSVSKNNKEDKPKKEKGAKVKKGKNNQGKKLNLEKQIEELENLLKYEEEEINKFCNDYEKLSILYNKKIEIENDLYVLMEEYMNLE